VIDLGANVGQFAEALTAKYACTCYAVEPMPNLLGQIRDNPRIRKLNYAISIDNAPVKIYVSRNREANSVHKSIAESCELESEFECPGITLESLLAKYAIAQVDLLKVDIEGSEQMLFDSVSDETLAGIKQITIEFHDFIAGSITTAEVQKIVSRLESIGFYLLPASYVYPEMLRCDLLFINKRLCATSAGQWAGISAIKALLNLQFLKAAAQRRS